MGVVGKFYCSLVVLQVWEDVICKNCDLIYTMNPYIQRIIARIVKASVVKDAKSSKYSHGRIEVMILLEFFGCNICGCILDLLNSMNLYQCRCLIAFYE